MTRLSVRQLAAYGLVVAVFAGGLWRVETTANRAEETADALERSVERNDARQCVNTWDVRGRIRQSDEEHGEAAGEALIEAVQPDDRELVARYRMILAEKLRAASEVVPDPECDLEDARRVLGER